MNRLRNFGFLLKDVSRLFVLRFEHHAREVSLTLAQCKVLVRLENNEGISQAKLAELTDIEPMTVVRILDRMEADQLLERHPDPADRRARRLYLTDKGRALLDEIWRLGDLTRQETFAGIGRKEQDLFMDLLERMHRNVSELDNRLPATPAPSAAQPAAAGRSPRTRSRQ